MPAAVHPGEFLNEILTELGVTQAVFARKLGVSPMRCLLSSRARAR